MNILMVMADQLSVGALPAYGNSVALTPNLDALARRGTVFENAYCPCPLCVPSRASMLTGRLTTRIASYDNGSELPASVPTFVHYLRAAGWRTILSGKMHFVGPDQLHGFEERLTPDIYPAGFEWTPDWSKGTYANRGASVRKLQRSGVQPWTDQLQYDESVQHHAIQRIRSLKDDRRPFFLCVSFTHPHDPFITTPEYWDRYEGIEIDAPAVPARPLDEMHEYDRWIQIHHELDTQAPDAETVLRSRRAYYGMVSYVDEKLGELVRELENMGLADETLVIFTSDHGEMLGEHGMWFKRTYREWSTRVPLIIARPGANACRAAEVVSLVDLFPTICDLAGIDCSGADIDGDSFAAALDGPMPHWKDTAISDYCGEGALRPMRMIRSGPWKYVYVHDSAPLLFNLDADPLERKNLAGDPQYRDIELSLKAKLFENYDPDRLHQDVMNSQQERLFLVKALHTGCYQNWDYRPPAPRRLEI